jgi:Amt family ammonium transporter
MMGFMTGLIGTGMALGGALPALAEEAAGAATPASAVNSGDTAWVLVSTALVMLMTIPGLALFYGGLVRKKNVLSVLMQCFFLMCAVSLQWVVCG